MRTHFLSLLLALLATDLCAQINNPFFKLTAVSFGYNIRAEGDQSLSFQQLSELATDPSTFTSLDLTSYHQGKYQFQIVQNDAVVFQSPTGAVDDQKLITRSRFDLQASFNILNKTRSEYDKHFEFKVGIFYQPYQYQEANYVNTENISVDSSIYHYAYYDSWTPMLGPECAFVYRTNPDKWYSIYGGVVIRFGGSLHPQVAETFGTMMSKTTTDTTSGVGYPVYHFTVLSNTQNIYKGKSSLLLEGGIPFGINFKIYKGVRIFLQGELTASKQFFINGPGLNQGFAFAETAGLRVPLD
jgi:hypothetical protein